MIQGPKQRVRRLSGVHVANEFQIEGSLPVDHHRSFHRDVADTQRTCSEASVQLALDVFEEGTRSRQGIVPANGQQGKLDDE